MKARKSLWLMLLACLLAACFSLSAAAESDFSITDLDPEDVEEVTFESTLLSLPLPIDFTGGFEPQEQYYLDDNTYMDPTIRVQVTYKDISHLQPYRQRTAGAWIVDIQIGDASQLRTAAAESFDTDTTDDTVKIAERVNAVVAFNADFIARQKNGYIFRQGVFFKDNLKGKQDVLQIDEDGDFHPVHLPKQGELSDTVDGKKVINAFHFGPILVENGEVVTGWKDFGYLKPDEYYARLALCQVGPLHYKVILTTHLQSQITGVRLSDFAQLCKDEGAIVAYNLDGGESTTLYFHHERMNNQYKVTFRKVPDIFYFASAWNGGNDE